MKTLEEVKQLAEMLQNIPTKREIFTILRDHGYERLGDGNFSEVFGHDGHDYVIKVCRSHDVDSWPFYAKFCIDNQDNPFYKDYLPKIHAYYRFKADLRRNWYIAVLDRLYPLECDVCEVIADRYDEPLLHEISALFVGFDRRPPLFTEDAVKLYPQLKDVKCWDWEYILKEQTEGFILEEPYIIAKAIYDSLYPFCDIDLHVENLMLTADGRPVITDPVSFSHQKDDLLDLEVQA